MNETLSRLPIEPADRFTKPFMRFLRIEALAGLVLLLSTLVAMLAANTAWSASYLAFWDIPAGLRLGHVEIFRSLKHWINDGLMTLFFFLIALELKRELVLGELRKPRVAACPWRRRSAEWSYRPPSFCSWFVVAQVPAAGAR